MENPGKEPGKDPGKNLPFPLCVGPQLRHSEPLCPCLAQHMAAHHGVHLAETASPLNLFSQEEPQAPELSNSRLGELGFFSYKMFDRGLLPTGVVHS